MHHLRDQIRSLLSSSSDRDSSLKQALGLVLSQFKSETGTIHVLDPDKKLLHLTAQIGLPPPVIDVVKVIPVGKGIAGETAARGAPVTMCNLQTDTSGVAKPGARQTGVGGALCVPLRKENTIVGTLGVGTIRQYEYTREETDLLEDIGRVIGMHIQA